MHLSDTILDKRETLFRETFLDYAERIAFGTAWALQPKRIRDLPALAKLCLAGIAFPTRSLPDPRRQLSEGGLCGIIREPTAEMIIAGYKRGLFTFAHYGPLKWISLPNRSVLFFENFHIATNVRRFIKQQRYSVTFDRDFETVIKMCAARRPGRWHVTWITPQIMRLYAELYDAGYAHSIEVWSKEGAMVGGSFGLAIGNVFFGESQFTVEPHTTKIAMAVLTRHLDHWGYAFSDGKWETPAMREMGFGYIPRDEFLQHLEAAVHAPRQRGRWENEFEPAAIANWRPDLRNPAEA